MAMIGEVLVKIEPFVFDDMSLKIGTLEIVSGPAFADGTSIMFKGQSVPCTKITIEGEVGKPWLVTMQCLTIDAKTK